MANSDPMQFSGDAVGAAAIFAGAKPASTPATVIERLNVLLASEFRAIENYNSLMKQAPEAIVQVLQVHQLQHCGQCELLRNRILELGGEPPSSSGTHGIVSHALHDMISAVGGDSAGLWALHESENNHLSDYLVSVEEVDPITAKMLAEQLIPAQQKHVAALEEMHAQYK